MKKYIFFTVSSMIIIITTLSGMERAHTTRPRLQGVCIVDPFAPPIRVTHPLLDNLDSIQQELDVIDQKNKLYDTATQYIEKDDYTSLRQFFWDLPKQSPEERMAFVRSLLTIAQRNEAQRIIAFLELQLLSSFHNLHICNT